MKVTDDRSSTAFTVPTPKSQGRAGFFVPSCPETIYLPPPSATTKCSTLHRGLQRIPEEILHLKNKFPALEIKRIWGLLRRLVKPSKLISFCQVQKSSSFTHLAAWLLADTEAKPKTKYNADLPRRVWSTAPRGTAGPGREPRAASMAQEESMQDGQHGISIAQDDSVRGGSHRKDTHPRAS